MPLVLAGATSGQATVQATDAATVTLTLPATSGTLSVSSGSPTYTNLAYTGTLTGGTGIVNLGSGQFYKDASGKVGFGTFSPATHLDIVSPTNGATAWAWFHGNTGGALPSSSINSGVMIGGNYSAGNSESNIMWGTGYNAATQYLAFSAWDNSTNTVTERMRIASGGLVSTTGSILSGGYVAGAGYYRSSGMVNETVTVTTEATVYSMDKDSGGGGSSSLSTYNITGLSNTDGSSAIIYVRNSNTAGGVNTVTIVQIHGTKVWEGNVQNTTKTASFGVFRQNGAWQTTAWSVGGVLNNVW